MGCRHFGAKRTNKRRKGCGPQAGSAFFDCCEWFIAWESGQRGKTLVEWRWTDLSSVASKGPLPNRGRTARKILDNQGDFKTAAAKSAAFQPGSDLAMIVDCWPSLPEHIKLAVLALIKSQSSG